MVIFFFQAFHIFLFSVSVIFLTYLQLYLLPSQKKEQVQSQNEIKLSVAYDNSGFKLSEDKEKDIELNQLSKSSDTDQASGGKNKNHDLIMTLSKSISLHDKISGRCVQKTVKGANFYLRLGAVGESCLGLE